jgi:hypothetical protein
MRRLTVLTRWRKYNLANQRSARGKTANFERLVKIWEQRA